MIDPDLKTQLDSISQNLTEINKKSGKAGIWRSFFNGMFSALGYVVGLVIVVLVLGWFLQKTGTLEAVEKQINNFTNLINSASRLIPQDQNQKPLESSQQPAGQQSAEQQTATSGQATVILPDGRQVQVQIPKQ